ncbi:hypothetical protein A2154_02315 [Candidatus Gottesmanbacteria bacterium RBG_16_43_7]|uniref:Uncharacterized protein n=1 Tax=Candidatus Gottesmanbacteria bacterium RBG_16_43_7 TaxID=1798373 RepID=A0A1F5ZBK7_9BACT|nr:MAG: hypothetical protein A2154_02315 [Candidatus Gottesmanbacteria bacterium RBG_16_43_7]
MQLDRDAIEEFKQIYQREYGKRLSEAEAVEFGTRLIGLVKVVYGENLPKVLFDKQHKKANN